MNKKYIFSFFLGFAVPTLVVFLFITWCHPYVITNMPWKMDYASDRNMFYKKFIHLKNKTDYTDLIVGSSTSGLFFPEIIKKNYGLNAYLGEASGALTPYKYAMIQYAIKNNPNLKHVIYVVDIFEFGSTDITTRIYYQKDIMNEIEPQFVSQIEAPAWSLRVQDFISEPALRAAIKTLKDYVKYKNGTYVSPYKADGSTFGSPIDYGDKNTLDGRTLRISHSYEGILKNMKELDPLVVDLFRRLAKEATDHNFKITFVINPLRPMFYRYFQMDWEKHNRIYEKWIDFVQSLASKNVTIADYSYPLYLKKGIQDGEEYWHDGIHYMPKTAAVIMSEIYGR